MLLPLQDHSSFLFYFWDASVQHRTDKCQTNVFWINNGGQTALLIEYKDARDSPRVESLKGSEVIVKANGRMEWKLFSVRALLVLEFHR